MMMESVDWRDVYNWPEYRVSRCGQVHGPRRLLKPKLTRYGYRSIVLCRNGQMKHAFVHRLVVEAFIGRIPPGMQVNHKDGDKANNHVSNLEIVTPSQNILHAFRIGLKVNARGDDHVFRKRPELIRQANAKLTALQVREIRRLYESGEITNKAELGRRFGVTDSNIRWIVNGMGWRSELRQNEHGKRVSEPSAEPQE